VALARLARKGAQTLAIIGSGVQAGSHLRAFREVWEFAQVRCWSPTAANLESFVETHAGVVAAESAEAAVRGADVVLIVTASPTPVVWSEWVSDGACVISVGACRPHQREMDPLLVARGRVFVDSRAAALKEAGDLVMAMAEGHFSSSHIAGELGEVLAGQVAGRTNDGDVTILKPLGQAVEDVAAAQLAYTRALALGRGVPLV
jgi:alanine dehydrogenase